MKRYTLKDNYDPSRGYTPAEMQEDENGEWMRVDDFARIDIDENDCSITMCGEAYRILVKLAYEYAVACGMQNYVESRVEICGASGDPPEQWVMTLQRCEGNTPHELRQEAEEKLERLQKQIRDMFCDDDAMRKEAQP
jgi:hypothetical protein